MGFILAKNTDVINVFQYPRRLELYYTLYGFLEKEVIHTMYDDVPEISVTVDFEILKLLNLTKTKISIDEATGILTIFCEENGYKFNLKNSQVVLDTNKFSMSNSEEIILPPIDMLNTFNKMDVDFVEIENDYIIATSGTILAYVDKAYDYEVTVNKEIINAIIKTAKLDGKILYNGSNLAIKSGDYELVCNTLNRQIKMPYASQVRRATVYYTGHMDLSDLAFSLSGITINKKDLEYTALLLDLNNSTAMYSTKKILGCSVPLQNDIDKETKIPILKLDLELMVKILNCCKTHCKFNIYKNSIGFKVGEVWLIVPFEKGE